MLPSLDFETYSEAGYIIDPVTGKVRGAGPQGRGGLPVVGIPIYAAHPSTEVLSLSYGLLNDNREKLWIPGAPSPVDLFEHIAMGRPLEAHNAAFEWWIWNMVCVRKMGWPPLPIEILHCSMVKGRRYNLPGALANLAEVLGTPGKQPDGTRLLRKLSVPNSPTKKRPGIRNTVVNAWDDFLKLYDYNLQDVRAEMAASQHIPELTPQEYRVYRVDRTINVRGVQVDLETLDAALAVIEKFEKRQTDKLVELTSGEVSTVSEIENMRQFIGKHWCLLPNLQADTIKETLEDPNLPALVRQTLTIRQLLSVGSIDKLKTLKLQTSSDGRLREQYRIFGADRTCRWSAGGVQLQNLKSGGPKVSTCEACNRPYGRNAADCCPRCGSIDMVREIEDWDIQTVEQAVADIRTKDLKHIERVWGNPLPVIAGSLRSMLVPKQGHKFVCVDFSAIEAVVQACLSRCRWRIEVFETHGKIYEASAAKATGIPFEEILEYKKRTGHHHPARSGVGKIRELANGYGGWINAAKQFGAEKYYEDDTAIKADILKWREESPEIVYMWGGQYVWCGPGKWDYRPELHGLEGAAIRAILNPGQVFSYLDISYWVDNDILHCSLPSGYVLHYWRPRLANVEDKLRRGPAWSITYEGWNTNPKKGPRGWIRMETYGGQLFENAVQHVAFAIQAEALIRAEAAGYPIVMHTHDEGAAEVPDDPRWNVPALVGVFEERSNWFRWYPIRATGWEGYRYGKF